LVREEGFIHKLKKEVIWRKNLARVRIKSSFGVVLITMLCSQ
jgi:hypothetical protein